MFQSNGPKRSAQNQPVSFKSKIYGRPNKESGINQENQQEQKNILKTDINLFRVQLIALRWSRTERLNGFRSENFLRWNALFGRRGKMFVSIVSDEVATVKVPPD